MSYTRNGLTVHHALSQLAATIMQYTAGMQVPGRRGFEGYRCSIGLIGCCNASIATDRSQNIAQYGW